DEDQPYGTLTIEERELRKRLRAKMKQFGGYPELLRECAYEHWHRMLFARFLAENNLLMHPSGVPVTLEECEELAAGEGAADGWELAARYASAMLPQIFRTDDPVLEVPLAPEHVQRLEKLLNELPSPVFTADDSLGWVYQYWQSKRKDEVNASEEKIDGSTIGPVTQLFTEPYMVQFLLHNTLGGWWMGRHPGEPLPLDMPYLRTLDDGTPAAGTFDGWPDTAAEITIMDPCCGSGHFLVEAFGIMLAFRMAEEGLSPAEAGDAVLRGNIHGLEIDARCTQLAAFALALAAWKTGGYRPLPPLNVACSGLSLRATKEEWIALADGDDRLKAGMQRLHDLFQMAPDLGSLIDPAAVSQPNLVTAGFDELQPLLGRALEREDVQEDEGLHFAGVVAQGIARAARLLAAKYALVATNVPYLMQGKQGDTLKKHLQDAYSDGKNDIGTAFLLRCLDFCEPAGTVALVTMQSWRYLGAYERLRAKLLTERTLHVLAVLGPNAFQTISGEIVNVGLFVICRGRAPQSHEFISLDASEQDMPHAKAQMLRAGDLLLLPQEAQLANPDSRIVLGRLGDGELLAKYAEAYQGICTGDYARFGRTFWELPALGGGWVAQRTPVSQTRPYGGCTQCLLWEGGAGALHRFLAKRLGETGLGAWVRGTEAWGHRGIGVGQMSGLPVTLYLGEAFDNNLAVIVPKSDDLLMPVWAYCSSEEFCEHVRSIDQSIKVTNKTLLKVPFDLEHWQKVADEMGPLPEPFSDDPTQWLFDGNPARTTEPLQVAVARLLGYNWPEQADDGLDEFADRDGIVSLPSVAGELPAADRLTRLLAAAFGDDWDPQKLSELLAGVDYAGKALHEWLRDGFFAQHCRLFHQRPFIWHLWDGRRDGFSVLVNYHRLDRSLLERLTYTYLGDWISRQRHANDQGEQGADARLVAAQELQTKLKLILEGERPHDIFVRWKPLHEQPIGWEPDINDGVRLNIRPFMEAGVLRSKPNTKWGTDRGKNPPDAPFGEKRDNDRHFTNEEKHAARREAGLE
ncbi:MAG TPA: hypothetical protein DGT21_11535, partial [Armatimonadetes bacterium]|nr:hypothetical protein [Armatimonadota bacterium]